MAHETPRRQSWYNILQPEERTKSADYYTNNSNKYDSDDDVLIMCA